MKRERIIEALKICDSNYDGVVCKKCPIKDEDYNGSWYDKDGDCYQHLMREAAELLSEQSAIQPEERTEERTETRACDLISRQAAIDEIVTWLKDRMTDGKNGKPLTDRIKDLPPAQPEEAIPVSWIESRIERFKAEDNAFCGLTANIMHVMLNEWKREQEDDNETGRIHGSGI